MNCMKCGREVTSTQVFCEDCLLDMGNYPVNPDTPVVLPQRGQSPIQKKPPKKRVVPLEEQVRGLRRIVRILAVLHVLVTVLAALMAYPAVQYLIEDHFAPGQNYTAMTTAATAPTETAAVTEGQ